MSARVKPGKTFEKLSVRQKNILRFVHGYIETHGYSPTMREIGQGVTVTCSMLRPLLKFFRMIARLSFMTFSMPAAHGFLAVRWGRRAASTWQQGL